MIFVVSLPTVQHMTLNTWQTLGLEILIPYCVLEAGRCCASSAPPPPSLLPPCAHIFLPSSHPGSADLCGQGCTHSTQQHPPLMCGFLEQHCVLLSLHQGVMNYIDKVKCFHVNHHTPFIWGNVYQPITPTGHQGGLQRLTWWPAWRPRAAGLGWRLSLMSPALTRWRWPAMPAAPQTLLHQKGPEETEGVINQGFSGGLAAWSSFITLISVVRLLVCGPQVSC